MVLKISQHLLDNFRSITVWIVELVLFYCLSPSIDEEWAPLSWLQVSVMAVLLYWTAVYNAPNVRSGLLRGEWYSLCLDYSEEYDVLQAEAVAKVEENAPNQPPCGTTAHAVKTVTLHEDPHGNGQGKELR